MQIVETTNEGLKRAYTVTIPAGDIDARVTSEVKRIAPQVQMPGFRPGKVPANLVRKMHGDSIHADALNAVVRESVDNLMREKQLRPALQPKLDLGEDYAEGKDAQLTVELEVLPEIDAPDIEGLTLEKLVVPVSDEQLDEALAKLAENQKTFKDAAKTKKAGEGDQILIDFVGRVDGTEFEGGKAENAPLVIGSGQFIPGFEEQLTGVKTGEERTITVTFPDDYPAEHLAGKEAEFDVTVQQVKVPAESTVDDDFAKSLGLEGLDKLKELMRGQLEQESAGLTRTQMKRQLLDTLAADYDFPVPPSMCDAEFEQIWQQLETEAAQEENPDAAREEIESERDDYVRIAERRVRLGLLLSEIGQRNNVEISDQEMAMLLQQAAQQYRPEDRERFAEYVRNDPMAQAQLRAPLYEEKVVDFLFDKAEVTEREVTREELEAAIEVDENGETEAQTEKKPVEKKPAKKAPAKKAAKKDEAAGDKADEKTAQAEDDKAEARKPAKKATPKKAAAKKDDAEKAGAEKAGAEKTGKAEEAKPAKRPTAKKTAAKK